MAKITYSDRGYASFQANVPADLVGKEDLLVELIPGTRKIQLYSATAGIQPLGTIFGHLEGDNGTINVRLLGKGGTCRMIANGAIASGKGVKPVAGGKVAQANQGDTIVGSFIGPPGGGAAAASDVIEVNDYSGVAF